VYPVSRDLSTLPIRHRPTSSSTSTSERRVVPARAVHAMRETVAPLDGDVEVSIRLFADGRSISVRRRVAPGPDGEPMTLGIDALIR